VEMEKNLIKIIKSLNRIMRTWNKLILRRTILNLFTLILFSQIIITTVLWVIGREISNTWLGLIVAEFGAFSTMLAYYFNERRNKRE